MFDKQTRAKMIVDHVMALDDEFGCIAPPRSARSTSRTRVISNDRRWEARVSFEYEKDAAGNSWHLFELSIYNQQRMTAVFREEEVVPRYYIPGKWEPIFIPIDVMDTVPLLP